MSPRILLLVAGVGVVAMAMLLSQHKAQAGEITSTSGYKVLEPIRHGSLTVFPVVTSKSFAPAEFLTLDEGLRSGDVVVTEYGNVRGLIRRHPTPTPQRRYDGAEVNRLVLVNNSRRPLLLLAGEIVTGGKQDRVIAKDRIVPPESEPIDLGVFCVEPGRWVASSDRFGNSAQTYASRSGSGAGMGVGAGNAFHGAMAQPSVRGKAMAEKDQQQVWAEVRKQNADMASNLEVSAAPAPAVAEVQGTTSYAKVMENAEVKKQIDEVARPIERDYQSLIRQLHDRHAVGVVVAVNERIIWADIFASTDLLEKYWPKLVRSYASEAVVTRAKGGEASIRQAEMFLDNMEGRKETIESEPGIYRHTEVNGDGFKAFSLTSLLPKTGFDVHVAKMAD